MEARIFALRRSSTFEALFVTLVAFASLVALAPLASTVVLETCVVLELRDVHYVERYIAYQFTLSCLMVVSLALFIMARALSSSTQESVVIIPVEMRAAARVAATRASDNGRLLRGRAGA